MKMQSNIYAPIAGRDHKTAGHSRPARGSQGSAGDHRSVSGPQLRKHEQFPLALSPQPARPDRLSPARLRRAACAAITRSCIFTTAKIFLTVRLPSFPAWIGTLAKPRTNAFTAGAVEPLIIVGIYNTGKQRIREYTPTRVPKLGGGRADRYAKFLIEEVRPFLQREYRTLSGPENTGIGGSSLGGLVSLYLGFELPHVFGKIAALSPSVWWNQRVIHRFARSRAAWIRGRASGWTLARARARASSKTSSNSATCSSKRLAARPRLALPARGRRASTTKPLGPSASVPFCNFCFRPAKAGYNPRHHAAAGNVARGTQGAECQRPSHHSLCQLLRKRPGIHAHLQSDGLPRAAFDGGKTSQCGLAARIHRRNVFHAGRAAAAGTDQCGELRCAITATSTASSPWTNSTWKTSRPCASICAFPAWASRPFAIFATSWPCAPAHKKRASRCRNSCHVLNYDDLREFMARVPAPWLLKPRSQASGIGMKKIHDAGRAVALARSARRQAIALFARAIRSRAVSITWTAWLRSGKWSSRKPTPMARLRSTPRIKAAFSPRALFRAIRRKRKRCSRSIAKFSKDLGSCAA